MYVTFIYVLVCGFVYFPFSPLEFGPWDKNETEIR